jgi:hypothetical protein
MKRKEFLKCLLVSAVAGLVGCGGGSGGASSSGSAAGAASTSSQTWNVTPTLSIAMASGGTFDLAATLPSGVAAGGTFSVDPSGSPLPAGMTLSPSGILTVGTAVAGQVSGVIFSYTV